jgi:hypothetical protein
MTKRVYVSSAQKSAAQAMVDRSALTGRKISDSVRKIANARLEPTNGASTADDVHSDRATAKTRN